MNRKLLRTSREKSSPYRVRNLWLVFTKCTEPHESGIDFHTELNWPYREKNSDRSLSVRTDGV